MREQWKIQNVIVEGIDPDSTAAAMFSSKEERLKNPARLQCAYRFLIRHKWLNEGSSRHFTTTERLSDLRGLCPSNEIISVKKEFKSLKNDLFRREESIYTLFIGKLCNNSNVAKTSKALARSVVVGEGEAYMANLERPVFLFSDVVIVRSGYVSASRHRHCLEQEKTMVLQ